MVNALKRVGREANRPYREKRLTFTDSSLLAPVSKLGHMIDCSYVVKSST